MLVTTRRRADCAGVACEHTLGRQPLHLYGYLWAKPEFIVDDKSGCFSFVVPDTVLFKQQKPVKWFFTSRQEKGKILTKSKKSLNVTHVLQAFTEPRRTAGSSPRNRSKEAAPDEEAIVATYVYPDRASNGELVMIVEHLTAAGVQHLLLEREKSPISVLQRFVPTRSGYNHLIQSVFTPDSCVLRKCVNSNIVSDSRLCIPERTATFEADERLVKPRDIASREIRELIEHMHLEMSNHLKKIIGKPVARNVAYFKHGADGRIYLLWSTMLSFESGSLAFAKNLRLSLSHQARLQHLVATSSSSSSADTTRSVASSMSANGSQTKRCPACRSILPSNLVDFFVTFKAIINAFECEGQRPNSPGIPPLLESALPPTSGERYKELCSNKEFLYRTIMVCQACAKQINSTKKPKADSIPKSTPQSHPVAKSDRDKPIYMQSAHSIFWGKAEREEASRKVSAQDSNPQPRPRTATARHSTRIRTQTLPTGLTRASLKRLLPDIARQSDNVIMEEPRHCMQMLGEHLRQRYGGPSTRLALARCNIYPPTPHVSIDLLRGIVDPRLLAEVSAYWNEFKRTSEADSASDWIDLDAFDGLLSAYADVAPQNGRPEHVSPSISITIAHHNSIADTSKVAPRALTLHPAPPSNRRPTSCSGVRSGSNRASRLSIRSASAAAVSVHDVNDTRLNQERKLVEDSQRTLQTIRESAAEGCQFAPKEIVTRAIDDIMCEVHVSAIEDNNAARIALIIQAHPLKNAMKTDTETQEIHPHALELTLTTDEILPVFSRSPQQEAVGAEMPHTADALVRVVLDALTIQDHRLVVRTHESLHCSDTAKAGSATRAASLKAHELADTTLTPEELRLLHDTLLRD